MAEKRFFMIVGFSVLLVLMPSFYFQEDAVVPLDGWGSATYRVGLLQPNVARYESLMETLYLWVVVKCRAEYEEDYWTMLKCIPMKPVEVRLHFLPYGEFMQTWEEALEVRDASIDDEKIDCVTERDGCNLEAYTIPRADRTYDVYFYEGAIDKRLVHEMIHIMENQRGEIPDEGRTSYRTYEFIFSNAYLAWLKGQTGVIRH